MLYPTHHSLVLSVPHTNRLNKQQRNHTI